MTELPKYYAVKMDYSNPLAEKAMKWFEEKAGEFTFSNWGYYGYDGSLKNNGYNAAINIQSFVNPVTILTLEEWHDIVFGKKIPLNKDLYYYKINAEEDYLITPISVLRYISELEKTILTTENNNA